MKKKWILFMVASVLMSSCNPIPNKSIFEQLTTKELAKAIKNDASFSDFYEGVRAVAELTGEVKKATYNDITYRRLFNYRAFLSDSTYWNPLYQEWEHNWKKDNERFIIEADSIIDYWGKYLKENSLSNYVKVELDRIQKKWYSYIDEIDEVYLGFKLTPLQGRVEQVRFTYGYLPKISKDGQYYEKHKCLDTDPLVSSRVGYWEVGYFDRDFFATQTVEKFLRDYNLYIEVTDIRKDGVNISKDDFNVPESISEYLEHTDRSDVLETYYKDKIIKELINDEYLSKLDYCLKEFQKASQQKDKLCFDFLKEISDFQTGLEELFDL